MEKTQDMNTVKSICQKRSYKNDIIWYGIVRAEDWFIGWFTHGKMPYSIQEKDYVVCQWSDFHDGQKSNIEGKTTIAICKSLDDAHSIFNKYT